MTTCRPHFSCCSLLDALQATEALRITSSELVKFGVMDHIVPEPLGGAHADPLSAFPLIKETILNIYSQ